MSGRAVSDTEFARRMAMKRGIRFCADCGVRESSPRPVPAQFRVLLANMSAGWKLAGGMCPVCAMHAYLEERPCEGAWSDRPAGTRCVQSSGLRSTWCAPCTQVVDEKGVTPTVRRSGRTLSALIKAVSLARDSGKTVQYVVASPQWGYCIDLLRKHGVIKKTKTVEARGMRFNGGGRLYFVAATDADRPFSGYGIEVVYDHTVRGGTP